MLSKRDGASDEQVSVFKQDDELARACRIGLMLGTNVGDGLPAMLHGAANAVLMMLRETMPE